jgi:hypothetical protein
MGATTEAAANSHRSNNNSNHRFSMARAQYHARVSKAVERMPTMLLSSRLLPRRRNSALVCHDTRVYRKTGSSYRRRLVMAPLASSTELWT